MEKSLNRFCLLWQCTLYKHTYTWWMVQSKTNNNFLYILLIFWLTVKKHLVTEKIETIVMYSLTDHFFDTLIFRVLVLIFCVTKRRSTLECESGDDKIGGHTYFFSLIRSPFFFFFFCPEIQTINLLDRLPFKWDVSSIRSSAYDRHSWTLKGK